MGQTVTAQLPESIIGDTISAIHYEIRKQAQSLRQISSLTYEEFHECVCRLNALSKKCWDSNGKVTIFAVKMGTDKSAFWKAFVRIACVKCDPSADNITSYKLINLRQFLTIFNTFQTHLEAMTSCEQQHDRARQISSLLSSMPDCSPTEEHATVECCICLDRTPDMILPCEHLFCTPCINRWNETSSKCPLCQQALDTIDESWVLAELPKMNEVNEKIVTELDELAYSSSGDENDPPTPNANGGN